MFVIIVVIVLVVMIVVPIIPSLQFSVIFAQLFPLSFRGFRSLAASQNGNQREQSNDVKCPHGGSMILIED